MFSIKSDIKSILFCGSTDAAKPFMFEVAMHWAEEGRRVFYITSTPLTSFPAIYHDRKKPEPSAFNMIKFIYLSNYEELAKQLVDLHTHSVLPSVLLIDNLHTYINDPQIKEQEDVHIAKLCALLHDSINACARIKKTKLYLCASVIMNNIKQTPYHLYFNNIWNIDSKNVENVVNIELKQMSGAVDSKMNRVMKYKQFQDGTLILNEILEKIED
ncbi:hypothetical protein PV325_013503 [Microctonus aethiopoides]|uniref:Uncharacterized protein n=1 Tax=Microctonus aethiopoides TaxID=144406 RepID=A0AA39FVH4_9HYME|nr:hypothetical protein PV325_013503 [Microctonus aethiopoides]KAK0176398.1 hypothetical protein PV328_000541 [Microctonus aethiopoides]